MNIPLPTTWSFSEGERVLIPTLELAPSIVITSTSEAEKYVLKKYKNGFQPMVNKDDIFISIKNEKFIID